MIRIVCYRKRGAERGGWGLCVFIASPLCVHTHATLYWQCVIFDPLVLSRFEGNHHQVRLMTNELQLNPQQLLIVHLLGQICKALNLK